VPPVPPEPPGPRPKALFTYSIKAPAEKIWLGVGAEETSEPLTAQLGLKPGEGLAVTYISTNSPAAIAGLQKNDVLAELDGQMLVDPMQLRKLIQMHEDGDSVKIIFYRGGKKQSASAKLVKHAADENFGFDQPGPKDFGNFAFKVNNQQLWTLDSQKLNVEVQQAMKSAQLALLDAERQAHDATDGLDHRLEIIHQKLGNLADGGMNLGKDSTVVVKNEGERVRTIVKKDESGTYVIVADPAKHLTAHDSDGKLLFDGTIDSPEQQQNVPKEVWEKAKPMLEQLDHGPAPRGKKAGPENGSQDE